MLTKLGIREPGWRPATDIERNQLQNWPLYRDGNGAPVERTVYKGSYNPEDWDTRPKQGRRP